MEEIRKEEIKKAIRKTCRTFEMMGLTMKEIEIPF